MKAELTARLGAYDIVTITKTFPRAFWAVLEKDGQVLLEMVDEGVSFQTRWVSAEVLTRALADGFIRLDAEL